MIVLVQSHNRHLFYIDIQLEQVGKVRVKVTPGQATKTQRGSRGSSTLSLTSALDGSALSTPRPSRFIPGKDPIYIECPRTGVGGCGKCRRLTK
jgi:hypothetical protein